MLDFNDILATPGYDFQQFYGDATVTLLQWQTWRKPRGVNFVYMIGVGGGGGGGTSLTNGTFGCGGGGGSSGAQTSLLIPAMFLPDILYIQAGAYGLGASTPINTAAGTAGTAGTPTYVCIEPDTTLTANMTVLFANGGNGGGAGTGAAGGTGGTAPVVATIANMPLAGRGRYNFFAGSAGTLGGSTGLAGTNVTLPFGLMVTGGAGGGGNSVGTFHSGGIIPAVANALNTDAFPLPINAGSAPSGSTPAGASGNGFISRNYMFNFGGAGGTSSNNTAGGACGAGGNGAPGCGGGGGGGVNSTSGGPSVSGNGGPGFVYIISW
jgi:hypothetical protein